MIKEFLEEKRKGHIRSGKFSISSIGSCWRKKYLELKGIYKEEFTQELLRLFNIGDIVHREITKELIEKGEPSFYVVASEINIPTHKYISGRIDNIISIKGENIIVDVKSSSDWTIKKIHSGEDCDQNYKDQVLLYMYLAGISKGVLLFVGKTKGVLEEFEVKYDEDRAKKLVNEIEDFFHNYIEKDIEPPKCDGGQWGCEVCGKEKIINDKNGKIQMGT